MTSAIQSCCTDRGLIYADGKRCYRHATAEDRALLADLDRRAARVGVPLGERQHTVKPLDRAWPYGPNIDVEARRGMLNWAEHNDLRLSRHGRCLTWLRKGRCTDRPCVEREASWLDHVTGWVRTGQPAVLVAQPCGLGVKDLAHLVALAREPGLSVSIQGIGWYGHGTSFVEVWRRND